MSSSQDQALAAAAANAARAASAIGSGAQVGQGAVTLRLGTVQAVGASGQYSVALAATGSGSSAGTINGVFAWGGSYEAGDRVLLGFLAGRPVPFIVGGAGGGAATGTAITGYIRFFSGG